MGFNIDTIARRIVSGNGMAARMKWDSLVDEVGDRDDKTPYYGEIKIAVEGVVHDYQKISTQLIGLDEFNGMLDRFEVAADSYASLVRRCRAIVGEMENAGVLMLDDYNPAVFSLGDGWFVLNFVASEKAFADGVAEYERLVGGDDGIDRAEAFQGAVKLLQDKCEAELNRLRKL